MAVDGRASVDVRDLEPLLASVAGQRVAVACQACSPPGECAHLIRG
jgi:hypothetical protein